MVQTNIEAERGRLQMTKTDMCNFLGITLKTYNDYIRGGNDSVHGFRATSERDG